MSCYRPFWGRMHDFRYHCWSFIHILAIPVACTRYASMTHDRYSLRKSHARAFLCIICTLCPRTASVRPMYILCTCFTCAHRVLHVRLHGLSVLVFCIKILLKVRLRLNFNCNSLFLLPKWFTFTCTSCGDSQKYATYAEDHRKKY